MEAKPVAHEDGFNNRVGRIRVAGGIIGLPGARRSSIAISLRDEYLLRTTKDYQCDQESLLPL